MKNLRLGINTYSAVRRSIFSLRGGKTQRDKIPGIRIRERVRVLIFVREKAVLPFLGTDHDPAETGGGTAKSNRFLFYRNDSGGVSRLSAETLKMFERRLRRGTAVFLLLLLHIAASAAWGRDGTVDILAFNDTHSQLLPASTEIYGIKIDVGGFAAAARAVGAEKARTPNLLVVLTGDITYGPMYRYFGGEPEYRMFSEMGVDAATLGNHEFDYGTDGLAALAAFSSFPILESNLEFLAPDLQGVFPSTFIKESNGLKVGFFGLITPGLASSSSPGDKVRVERDLVSVAREMVAQLRRQGADVVIALTHIGVEEDLTLARKVSGIHAILGGHSHTLIPLKTAVRGPGGWETLIGQAGSHTRYAGRLTLKLRNGRTDVAGSSWHTMLLIPDTAVPDDPLVAKIDATARDFSARLDDDLEKPVGEFLTPADATERLTRGGECPLGNFIADAYRWSLKTDIGLINGGGIRGDRVYPAGPVSYRTLMEIHPYANTLTRVYLTGEQLWTLAEIGASSLEAKNELYDETVRVSSGGFLHYSGMKVEIDLAGPPMKIDYDNRPVSAGGRVRSLLVENAGNWAPPDPEKLYSIATIKWTADGGDKTIVMNEAALKEPTEIVDFNSLADYIRHLGGRVDLHTERRIVIHP